ncbi:unnamed protein product, partial [Arabidopsis halleri]
MDSSSSFILTTVAAAIGFFTLLRNLRCHQEDDKENNSSSSTSPPPSSSSSLSPPSSLDRIWTHHVFPSFRGEDVRRDFLSHIQMEFQRMGITPFIDNEIKRGQSIGPELIRAIRESKIAIILLSRNYASSSWCLDELAEIMKCREDLGQTVLAVFYKVDPSDVKKLTGDFGKVFKKTCAGKTKEHVGRWRQALANVATIAGYHSTNWDNEAAMIKKIATDISNLLNNSASSSDFDGLVGMREHLEKMEPLLSLGSDEVRMIGIWGPSGIGKTTIARVIYNKLSNSFQLSVFMESIEAKYTRPCSDDYSAKLQLQQQFMSQITNQSDMKISHLGVVQDRLKDKKVLVVLDGVDKSMQLDAMAKETWWFGPGSRIIITTQDRKIFREHGINHIYKVGFPSTDEALQILCTYAFGQNSPKHGFEELAWEVTQLAGELPLGLRVMGSYFRGMSKLEWTKALPKLRSSLDADILSILKFSYDALEDEEKYLFLHIACFFNHKNFEEVEEHLAETFLDKLQTLKLRGCSKLEVLPANINLESLVRLYLTDCLLLKRFPEISTNVKFITLDGTAIEEVPSSIKSWSRLIDVQMSYSENLKNFPHAFDIITALHMTNTEIQECFKLNQEARDLIIQTPTSNYAILPGREVPAYFTHQSTTGGSLTIKLNEKPLPTSMRFKACILLLEKRLARVIHVYLCFFRLSPTYATRNLFCAEPTGLLLVVAATAPMERLKKNFFAPKIL